MPHQNYFMLVKCYILSELEYLCTYEFWKMGAKIRFLNLNDWVMNFARLYQMCIDVSAKDTACGGDAV